MNLSRKRLLSAVSLALIVPLVSALAGPGAFAKQPAESKAKAPAAEDSAVSAESPVNSESPASDDQTKTSTDADSPSNESAAADKESGEAGAAEASSSEAGTKSQGIPTEAPEGGKQEGSELRKSDAVTHYWLANSYFKRWDLELASIELQQTIMRDPGLLAAHKDFCLVSLLTGHPLRALAELMMLIGLGDPIPYTSAEEADMNLQASKLHYKRGLKLAYERQWLDAIPELQWAVTYSPEDPATYRSLAFAYANTGNFDKAEELYQTTFKMNPGDAFGHADFAFMLSDAGHKQQAEQQLSEAVKLAPSAAALHVDLGWAAESGGDFPTAEREFQKAVELSPSHGGLWAHLGRILEHEGKNTDAVAAYNQAIKLDPAQDEAKQSLARLQAPGAT
jgi:Flp pilus assembly protein TadD